MTQDQMTFDTTEPFEGLNDQRAQLDGIHRRLRGRYPWAFALAVIGLICGALAGYHIPTPLYRSTAQVRIAPVVPKVLYGDEEKRMLPRFEAFIETQVQLIKQQDTLHKAVADPQWQQLGITADPAVLARMAGNLEVEHPLQTETINVHYHNADPEHAQVTVNAVARAYLAISKKQEDSDDIKKITILQQRREELDRQLKSIHTRITTFSQVGAETMVQLHAAKLARAEKLEDELDTVQMAIFTAEEALSSNGGAATAESVASVDQQMNNYVRQRDIVGREITRLKAKFGSSHRAVREQQNILDGINDLIQLYMRDVASTSSDGGISTELKRLQTKERGLMARLTVAREDADQVGREEMGLSKMRDEQQLTQQKLADVNARIELLNLESAFSGRASILSDGALPGAPFIDHRAKVAAALGVLGLTLGFAVVLLIGFMDARIRSYDDACASINGAPVLGMLPDMPHNLSDNEQVTYASHAVHNIRTMMQIGTTDEQCPIYVITSPGPQTGKTSLAMALGLSFAGTSTKTLLIDCDLIGGGMSQRVETLLDDDALTGDNSELGLLDAVHNGTFENSIQPTQIPCLSVLPLGNASQSDVMRLSPAIIRQLFAEARGGYDAVIIDTGPIPASLEASLLAAQADGVVIVLSRGDNQGDAQRAIDHLHSCGANVVGMVFNRADQQDMSASGAMSVSQRSTRLYHTADRHQVDASNVRVRQNKSRASFTPTDKTADV